MRTCHQSRASGAEEAWGTQNRGRLHDSAVGLSRGTAQLCPASRLVLLTDS
jgi:hypothetical protein